MTVKKGCHQILDYFPFYGPMYMRNAVVFHYKVIVTMNYEMRQELLKESLISRKVNLDSHLR